jgi:rod shape-determining protein MreD
MKKYIFFLVSLLLFVTIQIVLLRHLAIRNVTPDLILIGVVYFSLKHGPTLGIPIGFFLGLLQDLFAFGLFGANCLIKTLIGFSVGTFQKRLVRGNIMSQIFVVFFACLFQYWSMYWIKIFFGQSPPQVPFFAVIFYPVYNSLLAPLLFWIMEQWEKLWGGGVYAPERNRSAI